MKTILNQTHASLAALIVAVTDASATVRYVDLTCASPTAPYTSWSTAATDIQAAIDIAVAGDQILVTNGIYQSGGKTVVSAGATMTNRVAVDKSVTVQSVNGHLFTLIQGYQMPATTNGVAAIRCVYLTNGASLSGFTLTNGATVNGQAGGGVWCQSTNCLVTNCVIIGNSASPYGGGAYRGTLINCTLTGNRAGTGGGGVAGGLLRNCRIFGNSAGSSGGGAFGNDATSISCTLYGCVLIGNTAPNGGGAYGSSGGNPQCTLNNCTVTGNSATLSGGGAYLCNLNNTIIYFNTAPSSANCSPSSPRNYCCTTPLPGFGVGNISAEPLLASASHLSSASPCRGAGTAAYVSGMDIDGEAWASPPSIGCDEFQPGAVTGPLSVGISAALTTVMTNYPVGLNAVIEGRMTASSWDFGDGLVSSNQPITTHVWSALGIFPVVLHGYNESNPGGVTATVTVHVVSQPVHYVSAISINPIPPYTSWATAAANIQDAVDAATVPGARVLVTNGIYASGGRALAGTMTNRVAVDKLLELRSVNGPQFTAIQGYQVPGTTNGNGAIRCVYLTEGASLTGFTLTNGATLSNESGGGVRCQSATAVLSNCVVVSNSSASSGGGASGGTLINCSLSGNSAYEGGGAIGATLNNCTLSANSAAYRGGGAYGSTLNDSALSGNSASEGGGAYGGTLNNCMLSTNSAVNYGGGVAGFCTLTNCILSSNSVFENQFGGGGGAHQSTLDHCTLTGNSAAYEGGGASGASTLRNCVVIGNAATFGGGAYGGIISSCTIMSNSAGSGGGVYSATLQNCVLSGNSASSSGGGASGGSLANCTITRNSADQGGGTAYCTLSNSIVYFNTAVQGLNYDEFTTLTYCCTLPAPTNGIGSITNEPLFADQAGGNFRLQSNSPSINAGDNASAVGNADLDSRPRIVDGTVDIGAYEFQPGVSALFLGWLQQYGLSTDGSADYADQDGDRLNNWQEWIAGTVPTNALSVLRLLNPASDPSGVVVTWQSVTNRTYFLDRATNLSAGPVFITLATNLVGQPATTSFVDTNALGGGRFFYRVGVQ